jgi:hypothetical protein
MLPALPVHSGLARIGAELAASAGRGQDQDEQQPNRPAPFSPAPLSGRVVGNDNPQVIVDYESYSCDC